MLPILLIPIIAALGVAEYSPLAEGFETPPNGSVIAETRSGDVRITESEYQDNMVGVYQETPGVAWSNVSKIGSIPVVSSGTALVRASAENGEIQPGDYITSSNTPGIAQKAINPGYVLGTARSIITPSEGGEESFVEANINVQFAIPEFEPDSSLLTPAGALQTLRSGYNAFTGGQVHFAIKYLLALLALLVSLVFGYWIFTRSATNSITAIGRNPLARRSIMLTAGLNVVAALAIVAGGVALGLFILAL